MDKTHLMNSACISAENIWLGQISKLPSVMDKTLLNEFHSSAVKIDNNSTVMDKTLSNKFYISAEKISNKHLSYDYG
jgi:hypothetical protein